MIASRTIMAGMSLPVLHPVSENLYQVAYRELEAKCDFVKFRQSTMRHIQ
jgi:hypothetical protein